MKPRRLTALVFLFAACTDRTPHDAAALVAAVDNYRTADNKAAAARAVEAASCLTDDVCAAKTACLAAIQPTLQGMALDDEVKKAIDGMQPGQRPDPVLTASLADKARRARGLLDSGHDAMRACDEKTTALRAKYHIE